jgi:hypothetical protein
VITLGDLNDGPFNNSVKKALGAKEKLMWRHLAFIILLKKWLKGFGTIAFRDSWDILRPNHGFTILD